MTCYCYYSAFFLLLLTSIATTTTTLAKEEEECSNSRMNHVDRISSLPGWDAPLPSAWYSGYLDYSLEGQAIHTHYILVEAEFSVEDKPLIYWSNGGPGASSFYGLFTELGPLLLSDDSLKTDAYKQSGIPSLIYNHYSWTRLGSILIFDQPAPVGFSYCTNGTDTNDNDNNCGPIRWTDELASANVFLALQEFYKRHSCNFPKSKELYLTGESYAGIYVPTFARRILEQDTAINLKGIAVGDGCLGTQTSLCGDLNAVGFGDFWNILFLAGHHQIPLEDFQLVMKACHHYSETNFLISGSEDDDACKAQLDRIKLEVGGYFTYSLYDTCTYRNGLLKGNDVDTAAALGDNDYPCGGGIVLEQYVRLDIVHRALKVQSEFFETDNAGDGFEYTPTEPDLTGFYREVVEQQKLRVLIYNGDTDPAITSFAAQNWTSHMGFEELQHWRPWTVDRCQRMGGYVTRYKDNFDFVTIRGAGHMVPTYKPIATYTFLKTWITNDGEDYPTFDQNCTIPPSNERNISEKDTHESESDEQSLHLLRGNNVETVEE